MPRMSILFDGNGNPFCTVNVDQVYYTRRYQTGVQISFANNTHVYMNADTDPVPLYNQILKDMLKDCSGDSK